MRHTSARSSSLAWIGILAIAVQMNALPITFLLFSANRSEISRTQCERKMPHCNGHCYLMKQLAKSSDTSEKQVQIPSISAGILTVPEDYLTLFSQSAKIIAPPAPHIASGWLSLPLQPPRYC